MGLVSTEDVDLGYEGVLATMERWVVMTGALSQAADVILRVFQLACGCLVCGVKAYGAAQAGLDDVYPGIHGDGSILLAVCYAMVRVSQLAGDALW